MGGWTAFLLAYLLGGVTFLPLVVAAVFLHAYYFLPSRPDLDPSSKGGSKSSGVGDSSDDGIVQPGDDVGALKAAAQKLSEAKSRAAALHDTSDVAAGYFAVCREYAPMGINAKPIERTTPVGSTTVAAPSPSVYQTMYRSIFERKQQPNPLDNQGGASQRPRKAGNVFYVVLRHGHIMLFDDDEQLEVRHVISLAHHDVSIFSGEDEPTPEGELYIKKNAICLTRKPSGPELGPDTQLSKPFYLFSENCSAKEDFYFSLLRNQEHSFRGEEAGDEAPTPLQFDVKHIIGLVQKLHSSEDHLQTRWLNALIGRMFLGVYRTKDLENFIREKLTKKISRVKRPSFLSGISIQKIETGDSAPYITNPRLKDLTVEGECGLEADVKYTGNFRIEVAATARIDLGSRFKAREVNLVLAVVLRKLEGHVLVKIKPPPSNRIWVSFQTMPKMEMTLEPIISSKQITYTVILRQIESRIKEVVQETLVLPFWDDTPFFNTEHKQWRGGIFEGDDAVVSSTDLEKLAAQIGEVDEVDKLEEQQQQQTSLSSSPSSSSTTLFQPPQGHGPDVPHMEKSHSLPVVEKTHTGLFGRKLNGKATSSSTIGNKVFSSSSASIDSRASSASNASSAATVPVPPRTARSGSFTGPPEPVVGTDATNAEVFKPSSSPPSSSSPAAKAMASISAKSSAAFAAAHQHQHQNQHQGMMPPPPTIPAPAAAGAGAAAADFATPSRPARALSKLSSGRGSGASSRSRSRSRSRNRGGGRDTNHNDGGSDNHAADSDYPKKAHRRHTSSSAGSSSFLAQGAGDDDNSSIRGSIKSQAGTLTRNFFSLRNKPSLEALSSASNMSSFSSSTTTATAATGSTTIGGGSSSTTTEGGFGGGGGGGGMLPDSPRRATTLSAVTAAAKRWGLNALQRNSNNNNNDGNGHGNGNGGGSNGHNRRPSTSGGGGGSGGGHDSDGSGNGYGYGGDAPLDLSKPMGGGRPLPPPGQPLPMPDKKSKVTTIIPVPPKRKAVPVHASGSASSSTSTSTPPPPLPVRPSDASAASTNGNADGHAGLRGGEVGGSGGYSNGNGNGNGNGRRSSRANRIERRPVPPPQQQPVSKRMHMQQENGVNGLHYGHGGGDGVDGDDGAEHMLVVEAPVADESEPDTPLSESSVAGRHDEEEEKKQKTRKKTKTGAGYRGTWASEGSMGAEVDEEGGDKTVVLDEPEHEPEHEQQLETEKTNGTERGKCFETPPVQEGEEEEEEDDDGGISAWMNGGEMEGVDDVDADVGGAGASGEEKKASLASHSVESGKA